MIVRRVGPMSCARIVGSIYAVIGLIIGAIFTLAALGGMFAAPQRGPFVFGMAAVIVLPVLYGVLAFVMTLVVTSLYNVLADRLGGIDIDVQ